MPVELRHLRNFLHLAETLSFSRGAAQANISQSSMTEQIQRLEDLVGVRLVDRSRRHVRLTLAGETLRQQARQLLDRVESLLDETRRAGGLVRAQLRIGYSEMALRSAMPAILQRFRHDNPLVDPLLIEQSSAGAEQALLDHQVDCAFVPGTAQRPEISALEIGSDLVLACVAETSPLARHSLLTPRQIAQEPVILPAKGNRFGNHILAAFAKAGFEPRVLARINRASAILTLVAAGEGVGFIPLSLTGLVPGGVLIRPFGRPQLSIPFSLLWRKNDAAEPLVELIGIARSLNDSAEGPARPPPGQKPRTRRRGESGQAARQHR